MFAPLGRELNFQQNPSNISNFTVTLVTHYLGKFKILICLAALASGKYYMSFVENLIFLVPVRK